MPGGGTRCCSLTFIEINSTEFMPIEMEAHQLVGSTSSSQSNQSQLIGLESQGPRELNPQSSISIWPRWSELRLDANQFHSLLIASTIPSPLIGRQFTSIISNCIQPQLNSVTWHTKLLIIAQPHFARPFLFFFFSFSSSFTSFFSFLFLFSFFFFFYLFRLGFILPQLEQWNTFDLT